MIDPSVIAEKTANKPKIDDGILAQRCTYDPNTGLPPTLQCYHNSGSMPLDWYNDSTKILTFPVENDVAGITDSYALSSTIRSNCKKITGDLSNCISLYSAFKSVPGLTEFTADLSNLETGRDAFYAQSSTMSRRTNFKFKSNLGSLRDGTSMFEYCKLDTESLQNIADTIKTWTDGKTHYITLGYSTNLTNDIRTKITNKGWNILTN